MRLFERYFIVDSEGVAEVIHVELRALPPVFVVVGS